MSGAGASGLSAGPDQLLRCQESYACSASEAAFECDECGSLQCAVCERQLHNQPRLRDHERSRLKPGHLPFCDQCNGNKPSGGRRRACCRCLACKVNVCAECHRRGHSNRRKHPVNNYPQPEVEAGLGEDQKEHRELDKLRSQTASSFLLVDEQEMIQVADEEEFIQKLGCKTDESLKVVSIFGNTGDGKSYTLNHTFFYGHEVFKTSPAQESCTVGVWAAYDHVRHIVVIDTEGLLGATANLGQRTRLLLKVLAISDIIIYRTRTDRLHNDLFKFLSDASEAYLKHFTKELKATTARCGLDVPLSTLGPSVIIFHETMHTKLLGSGRPSEMPEKLLQERFRKLSRFPEAFCSIQYTGTRTHNPPTDFSGVLQTVEQQLNNNATRSPRPPGIIFKALKALSDRFNGEIADDQMAHSCFFPDEYFTCSCTCLSCGIGCKNSMNHAKDGIPHESESRCSYSHQYDNRVYTCKSCYEHGKEVNVVPKTSASTDSPWLGLAIYAWSGYVIECPNCGIIYRSRQYWFGNQDPVDTVVRTEIEHVWLGTCHKCNKPFEDQETKHHCRACGEGFCDGCSTKSKPVPERGWGSAPVRVCDGCYEAAVVRTDVVDQGGDESGTIIARKVGEAVQNTFGAVATAIDFPLGLVKDAARPSYWVPDHEITDCCYCRKEFTAKMSKHHCRACGQGFCNECSQDRRTVTSRGWDHPVRVCINCNKKPGDL
ncbi:zinc finger FYVE domain-containing protein 1 isoform X2 [Stegostoma tigrinum]|uniref:zinc finger FYVE domain-containing protein 1 isoform X2 n=1 Tax=Stegostoma tigrinum TaxID=3053191 RepID=UPI002870AF0B|nr:zinc finger FYVE domain-containing protein 1 isoform X2 [Stegostoma tigrinum]